MPACVRGSCRDLKNTIIYSEAVRCSRRTWSVRARDSIKKIKSKKPITNDGRNFPSAHILLLLLCTDILIYYIITLIYIYCYVNLHGAFLGCATEEIISDGGNVNSDRFTIITAEYYNILYDIVVCIYIYTHVILCIKGTNAYSTMSHVWRNATAFRPSSGASPAT